jgi:hypothetical protein
MPTLPHRIVVSKKFESWRTSRILPAISLPCFISTSSCNRLSEKNARFNPETSPSDVNAYLFRSPPGLAPTPTSRCPGWTTHLRSGRLPHTRPVRFGRKVNWPVWFVRAIWSIRAIGFVRAIRTTVTAIIVAVAVMRIPIARIYTGLSRASPGTTREQQNSGQRQNQDEQAE